MGGARKKRVWKKGRDDEGQGKGDGARGRNEEALLGIEDAHEQGRQGDKVEKGEHDPDHFGPQGLAGRIDAPSGGQEGEDLRGEEHAADDDRKEDQGEKEKNARVESFGGVPSLPVEGSGQGWNEGRGKGPFRKKFPKHVRNPVGHIKEVGHRSGAEAFGNQHVPEKSEEAGEKDGDRHAGTLAPDCPDGLVAVRRRGRLRGGCLRGR